jgi:TPR repeat protein
VLFDRGKYADAAKYFERVCGDRSASGCVWLGIAARDGRGRSVDQARAKELFQKACSRGIKVGCKLATDL